ncbi:TetR/AcrR family transcriptional regulator [Kribbella sp. NPDC051587]|uniref:TetR/AcrR family transcriptional regulator n=1 Tax=Kribbella sp. NPDC051587 TaxID=3364119 RepID=UPI00378D7F8A
MRRGLQTFAELGYELTTVRELARRIGVSHNYVNERYGSKLGFWRAVVDFGCSEIGVLMSPEDARFGDDELLAAMVLRHYRNVAHHPAIHRVLWDEAARESERLDYLYSRYMQPTAVTFLPVLERLIGAGKVEPTSPDLLYFSINGPSAALVQRPLARRLAGQEFAKSEDLDPLAKTLGLQVITSLLPALAADRIPDVWPVASTGTDVRTASAS